SIRVFGTKSTTYSAPRYSSVWPRWRPNPFTSVTVIPETPMSDSAARTSSSLNGLMMAVTSFMCELSVGCLCFVVAKPLPGFAARAILQLSCHAGEYVQAWSFQRPCGQPRAQAHHYGANPWPPCARAVHRVLRAKPAGRQDADFAPIDKLSSREC